MNQTSTRSGVLFLLLLGILGSAVIGGDAPAEPPKPSQYAPAADLVAQVDYYLERIEKSLADEAGYNETRQDQVLQEAFTLAVLAQVLGQHDQDHALKGSAAAMVSASQELAESSADIAAARQALEKLKAARTAAGEGELNWEPVGDLAQLMQQVPIVNNNMRRAVTSRRFEREIDQAAEHAAVLAAIAQSTMHDPNYFYDEDTEAAWKRISAQMRDAAGVVNAAVRRGDQEAATAALATVVTTCDACHAEFR